MKSIDGYPIVTIEFNEHYTNYYNRTFKKNTKFYSVIVIDSGFEPIFERIFLLSDREIKPI